MPCEQFTFSINQWKMPDLDRRTLRKIAIDGNLD